MQVPKQLPRTLVALVVTYVLASVIEAVNLVSAARVGLEMGIVEVPYLGQIRLLITGSGCNRVTSRSSGWRHKRAVWKALR